MEALLEIKGLRKQFGGIIVANDVDLELRKGEVVGLIGPNGAGKTSLFNLVCGFERQDAGIIALNQRPIERLPAYARARIGVSRTWQNTRLFPSLTVLDTPPRHYGGESILRVAFEGSQERRGGDYCESV
jgi:branched-chain amino acid transport system ATP-binding protein